MFEVPTYTDWNMFFTAIGAMILWGSWGRRKLKPFMLSGIVRLFLKGRTATFVEFLVFIILGTIVGVAVVKPVTAAQALTAGFAWTGALARPED